MVAQIVPEWYRSVGQVVNRFQFKDHHEALSDSLDPTSFADNRRKASHDQLREYHDDLEVHHT